MKRLEEIIDGNTEGNYLFSSTNKTRMMSEILDLLDSKVSCSLKEDRARIFGQLLIEEEETAFSSKITVHTDDLYNVIFKKGTIKP